MAFVGIDVAQTRINLHPEKSLRQLSSSRLANRRIHAYHSVIAMSLLHPALLMLTLFIVLRIRSKSLRFKFHHKRCYHSDGSKATGGSEGKTTGPPLTFRETTVLMCVYAEKGEMYLQVIIHQRLVMSGDVELNPGPLDVLDLRNVTNELCSVIDKWFRIGVQLGLDETKLNQIEDDHRNVDRRFSEVISFWLNRNTQIAVSWKSLVEVLESPFVNEKGLARRLREKGGMGEPVDVPAAGESGVEMQEINGGNRGKKRSVEEKLDNDRDENEEFAGGPESKKVRFKGVPTAASESSQISENEDTSRVGLASHSPQATSAEEASMANMFVTLDDAYKNCTVSNLHLFVSKLRELLNLSSGSGGSLKLTFQLPHTVQQAIFPLSGQQEEALASLGVTELSCGDYLLTNKPAEDHEMKDIVEPTADLRVEKPDDTSSIADSALGTSSIITGATRTGVSQFSEDLMLRDLRDEPYLTMEAKLGQPDDSSGLELHWAAYRGKHMDPLCQKEDGYTPLHLACLGGNIDVIQYLISEMKQHTSLDSIVYNRTKAGTTAVDIAALKGHLPVVKLFISELIFGSNTPGFQGRPPLVHAAQGGHLNVVRYFIEELHCDPSYASGEEKITPLHMAAQQGHLDVIRYLTLNRNCSPLIRNSRGDIPLHEAAGYGRYETVKFFISELNCDPNTPGQWGRTPLHSASQEGHLNIVQYLIDIKKCNPASLDNQNTTPLHLASAKGQLHIVKYLIEEKHCNPLCYDKHLGTSLHWAAQYGQLEILQYLVEACKSPVNIIGAYHNKTPLELARAQGHTNVVQYLSSQV